VRYDTHTHTHTYIYIVRRQRVKRSRWWRSWLVPTSRKFVGSISDVVIGIFHGHNPSGRTMAQGLTKPLTEISTRNNSWVLKAAGA
jgi:hypothetical protein